MKTFLILLVSMISVSIAASAQKPTKEDISAAMKRFWEQDKGPRKTVTIHSIQLGLSETATLKQQVEGIPKGTLVTHATIDWTHHSHYTDKTQSARRIMSAWVFKDPSTGNWRVKSYRSKSVD